MPNPLDFQKNYHQQRGFIESAPKQTSPMPAGLETSPTRQNSPPLPSHQVNHQSRQHLPSLNSLTQQEQNVAKLKERLSNKKFSANN